MITMSSSEGKNKIGRFTPLGERVYHLLLELAAIPSVTGSENGEVQCARFIYDRLSRLGCFVQNPENLKRVRLRGDLLNRAFICALVRAKRPTKRTVILTGHFDVVDVDVCGPLRPWAFDPEEYTRRIKDLPIPEDARRDLDSGNYLFGRGVMDMKTGIALNMCLLEDYAVCADDLEFNVMLLLVPDEEGDSAGMRAAIPLLAELQEKEGLDFLVCLNTEPFMADKCPGMFHGSIGKMMPLFLCVGREAHVADYDEGLNSTLIASYLNLSLEGSPGTREEYRGQLFPPCSCLRMRDLRAYYSVTLPERTVIYYNYLTVKKTPASLLKEMKEKAAAALSASLEHVGQTAQAARVLDIEELFARAERVTGKSIDKLAATLLPRICSTDERERNIAFLSDILDLTGEKGPLIVVGFLPPFYPARCNEEKTPRQRALRLAAEEIRQFLLPKGLKFKEVEILQGISDLSYTGFDGEKEDIIPLSRNMPLWEKGYDVSLDDLSKIDIPSVVLGPIGCDAHKITERVELDYSMNILPEVVKLFLSAAARHDDASSEAS
ncbi:MAG: M20/M25/M40 family metallo-hydrolase [Fretibacterium sp.]|nr:M20/M25/M40 family metallo-hydrolase [Fretibacterium sp.]